MYNGAVLDIGRFRPTESKQKKIRFMVNVLKPNSPKWKIHKKWREKSLLASDGIKSEIALSLGMGAKVCARRNWMMTCLECEELILGSSKAGDRNPGVQQKRIKVDLLTRRWRRRWLSLS